MRVSSLASFAIGVQMLRTNPLRTLLSTLGIIIGVASLVAILSLGDGLEQFSRQQIEETTDLQIVQVEPRTMDNIDGLLVRRSSIASLTPDHAVELARQLEGRASAMLVLSASVLVRTPADTTRHAALATAIAPPGALTEADSLIAGEGLDAPANTAYPHVVLGSRLASDIADSPAEVVGRSVILGEHPYTVVGVLGGAASERMARAFVALDDSTTRRFSEDGRRAPAIIVRVHRIEDVPAVEAETRAWLGSHFPDADRDFTVATSRQRVDQVRRGMLVFKLAMGAITGISIIVGGIGIMNVLLASVQERTREIGVRRATGARRADIFLQFIAESVAVSGIGSIIGVLFGLGGAFAITAAIRSMTDAPVHAAFTWPTIVVAAAAALTVGIAFGSYPASHAARLSPIDAIRHE